MSSIKNKLFGATAMLMASTVMLTTASYAWFTISTAPEVTSAPANVTANGNLEIALSSTEPDATAIGDKDDNSKWGNLVTIADETLLKLDLKPLTDDGGVLKYATYGEDGRIDALAATADGDASGGIGYILAGSKGPEYGYYLDLYLRSNVAGAVSLTGDGVDRGNGETGAGTSLTDVNKELADKIKVRFVPESGTPVTATFGTDGALTSDIEVVSLEANTATKVTAYVYLDGADLTNADMTNAATTGGKLNLQFKHAETLVPMKVTGSSDSGTTPTN